MKISGKPVVIRAIAAVVILGLSFFFGKDFVQSVIETGLPIPTATTDE